MFGRNPRFLGISQYNWKLKCLSQTLGSNPQELDLNTRSLAKLGPLRYIVHCILVKFIGTVKTTIHVRCALDMGVRKMTKS